MRMGLPIQMCYGIGNLEFFKIFSSIWYSKCLNTISFSIDLNPTECPACCSRDPTESPVLVTNSILIQWELKHSLLHVVLDSHNSPIDSLVHHELNAAVKMDASSLHCSQWKDVDRSTLGTATTVDEDGNAVRRSTREWAQWVLVLVLVLVLELLLSLPWNDCINSLNACLDFSSVNSGLPNW